MLLFLAMIEEMRPCCWPTEIPHHQLEVMKFILENPKFCPEVLRSRNVLTNSMELSQSRGLAAFPMDVHYLQDLQNYLKFSYEVSLQSLQMIFHWEYSLINTPASFLFDLSVKYGSLTLVENPSITYGIIKKDAKFTRILLTAPPGFGKSALFSLLAFQWAASEFPISDFQLCILHSLGEMKDDETDIESSIVRKCTQILKLNEKGDITNFKKCLRDHARNIVIFLDGCDELTESGKHNIENFCKQSIFMESTIVFSSRTSREPILPSVFEKQIIINNFSTDWLSFLLEITLAPEVSRQWYHANIALFKKMTMFQFSTITLLYIRKLINNGKLLCLDHPSLYDTMNCVAEEFFKSLGNPDLTSITKAHHRLGKMFLEDLKENLSRDTYHLDKETVQKSLGNEYACVLNSGIFVETRNAGEYSNGLIVPNKNWMLFFSVKYLRHLCDCQTSGKQKEGVIVQALCSSPSKGKYGQLKPRDQGFCFEGDIPDIVVHLGQTPSWGEARIEMRYDVDRVSYTD